jgi:hypothetical protein
VLLGWRGMETDVGPALPDSETTVETAIVDSVARMKVGSCRTDEKVDHCCSRNVCFCCERFNKKQLWGGC